MGIINSFMYRPIPERTYNSEEGFSSNYDYGANQITGWRRKQEDRYVCIPKFHDNLSMFAVYDGHGGQEVSQYLQNYLHHHVFNELMLHNDPELALYLGFLTCDNSMRSITEDEVDAIHEDIDLEIEVPNKEERRRVIFGKRPQKNSDDAVDGPDSAGSSSNVCQDSELRSEIASVCFKELASLKFLTAAPLEDDESDESYDPEEEEEEEIEEEDDDDDCQIVEYDDDISDEAENGNTAKNKIVEQTQNDAESAQNKQGETSTDNKDEGNVNEKNQVKEDSKSGKCAEAIDIIDLVSESEDGEVKDKKQNEEDEESDSLSDELQNFGKHCGSTATVLLFDQETLFVANVGDSRCVACVKGEAVDLSTDHKPFDAEEKQRIVNAGGSVSEEGRVNDNLDMSRALGDFDLKKETVDEPFQILSCEPSIQKLPISPEVEFVIIASDGIWNSMDSREVIHYLSSRLKDSSMELRDICGELFEEILAPKVTGDGSGCDNMTAILIRFGSSNKNLGDKNVTSQETYVYKYPDNTQSSVPKENPDLASEQKAENEDSQTKSST